MKSLALVCLAGLWLAGCATPPTTTAWTPTGDPVVDAQNAIAQGPKRDRVLWEYRAATSALRRGQWPAAKPMLDDALASLNTIFGPRADAKRARSYFGSEAKKTFIGEPYERVMAYYYRAILYWMDGEPDNARACFRSAQLMDSDAAEKSYASDYVLLDYLDGLATAKLDGDAQPALQRARTAARLASPPDYDPAANVLFFIELGRGPTKYATGQYGEELRFRPGAATARQVRLRSATQTVQVEPYDDLTFQATTRGGRLMDHVLANKAVFKGATSAAGDAALISGAILATQQHQHSAADEVGAGLLIAGLVSKIISAATTPAADTRAWDNLPQYLSFAALRLPPGPQTVTVDFLDAAGQPVAQATQTLTLEVLPRPRDTVVFLSDQKS